MSYEQKFNLAKSRTITYAKPSMRNIRNTKLAQTDWTQLPDNALTAEQRAAWATYRQALRDLPESGDANNIVWPQEPV